MRFFQLKIKIVITSLQGCIAQVKDEKSKNNSTIYLRNHKTTISNNKITENEIELDEKKFKKTNSNNKNN